MAEIWRLIHDDFYEVSDMGNIRRAKPGISTFVGRPCLPICGSAGYAQVALSGLKTRRAYVHHLVAEAFIGPRPDGYVVNHIDANKQNNARANLEYVSRKENSAHALRNVVRRIGPRKPPTPKLGRPVGDSHWSKRLPDRIARGSSMPHSKLTAALVVSARTRVANGELQSVIARELGISMGQMSRIIKHQRWTYV